jgi:hypothetical protein
MLSTGEPEDVVTICRWRRARWATSPVMRMMEEMRSTSIAYAMCLSVDTPSPFFSRRRETAISLPRGALPSAAMHGAVYHRGIHVRERSTGPQDPKDSCCGRRRSYDVKYLDFLPPQISAAMQLEVMRTQCGFNLHRLHGQGAHGVAVEVNHQGRRFTVKLSTCAYSGQSSRSSSTAAQAQCPGRSSSSEFLRKDSERSSEFWSRRHRAVCPSFAAVGRMPCCPY